MCADLVNRPANILDTEVLPTPGMPVTSHTLSVTGSRVQNQCNDSAELYTLDAMGSATPPQPFDTQAHGTGTLIKRLDAAADQPDSALKFRVDRT